MDVNDLLNCTFAPLHFTESMHPRVEEATCYTCMDKHAGATKLYTGTDADRQW